jgi:hypothetical protein
VAVSTGPEQGQPLVFGGTSPSIHIQQIYGGLDFDLWKMVGIDQKTGK